MAVPRSRLVRSDIQGMYHCISRCVRRAFLCGKDSLTNRDYEHRKEWLRQRIKELASIFYIDVCSYGIMQNHFHIVLRIRPESSKSASRFDIAMRWWQLFPGRRDVCNQPEEPSDIELENVLEGEGREAEIRQRLSSLSWFMRCLKEDIAKRANKEDECTGHFWEGRFKSIALLDSAAVLACTAYVDLNPIRAGVAETPEESDYTSAQDRIVARQAKKELSYLKAQKVTNEDQPSSIFLKERLKRDEWLCPLQHDGIRKGFLNISVDRYLEILDWTGRRIKDGKKGRIPRNLAPILERLEVDHDEWVGSCLNFGSLFYRAAGKVRHMRQTARDIGQKWLKGVRACRASFI